MNWFGHQFAVAQTRDQGEAMQTRPIPSSGEALPVIGCSERASAAHPIVSQVTIAGAGLRVARGSTYRKTACGPRFPDLRCATPFKAADPRHLRPAVRFL